MHPLASSTWDAEEKAALLEVIESGRFTMGDRVSEFEKKFAEYIGTKYAVMCNSGSSANLLMVAAYTLRYGKGTVVAPVLGWSTSYAPFQQYGWKFRFVDIDESLNINPSEVWRAVKEDDPVILCINILGNPCDFYALPRKCHVLEDNCESLGAEYGGRRTGSFGLMGTQSLFFSHHICTMEGGVVTTNDEYLYHMLLALRSHGWTRHLPAGNLLRAKVEQFNFILPGYNVRPIEMMGAVGMKQLDKLDSIIKVRRDNAKRLDIKLQKEVGKSSWYGFAVADTPDIRAKCETRPVVTGNFLKQPMIKYFGDFEVQKLDYINEVDNMVMIGNHASPVNWEFLNA